MTNDEFAKWLTKIEKKIDDAIVVIPVQNERICSLERFRKTVMVVAGSSLIACIGLISTILTILF